MDTPLSQGRSCGFVHVFWIPSSFCVGFPSCKSGMGVECSKLLFSTSGSLFLHLIVRAQMRSPFLQRSRRWALSSRTSRTCGSVVPTVAYGPPFSQSQPQPPSASGRLHVSPYSPRELPSSQPVPPSTGGSEKSNR